VCVTLPAGGRAALHGGPVMLHPVRATPCYINYAAGSYTTIILLLWIKFTKLLYFLFINNQARTARTSVVDVRNLGLVPAESVGNRVHSVCWDMSDHFSEVNARC